MIARRWLILLAFVVGLCASAGAQDKSIVVASTTSTQDSGLFDYLLPIFTQKTGVTVRVVALGSGQAFNAARRGEADVLFTHYKIGELQFVAEGHGVKRYPVMYNDFVLVGPAQDPGGIAGEKDVVTALEAIRNRQAVFISRGDRSGTHFTELALWNRDAGINIENEGGAWYRPIAQGMQATLETARAANGYTLSDRGTWISLRDKGDLKIIVEGDKRLFNQYGVILVSPERHPNVKKEFGQAFVDWLVSPEGQKAIADYKIDGQQLFIPNAHDPNA
jgi:tungstate transport system substrate-binding protein